MQDTAFQQTVTADQEKQRQHKADDLQHEVAGQETGRIKRHLPHQQSATMQEQQKEREERTQTLLTLAMLLANNPEYAKLHSETMDIIVKAEAATEAAIAATMERLTLAQEQLNLTLQSATRIPDGKGGTVAVFRDDDGRVWTEHDEEITDPAIIDGIMWKDGSPSHDDYHRDRQSVTNEQNTLDELYRYQMDVLGDAREKMTDPDNPPQSTDEIQDIQDKVKHSAPDMVADTINPAETKTDMQATAVSQMHVPTFK